jgi:hypothetical protein
MIQRDAGLTATQSAVGVDLVVAAGLWTPNGSGFELHDFVAMNVTREKVEHEREAARERQRQFRARQRRGDQT